MTQSSIPNKPFTLSYILLNLCGLFVMAAGAGLLARNLNNNFAYQATQNVFKTNTIYPNLDTLNLIPIILGIIVLILANYPRYGNVTYITVLGLLLVTIIGISVPVTIASNARNQAFNDWLTKTNHLTLITDKPTPGYVYPIALADKETLYVLNEDKQPTQIKFNITPTSISFQKILTK